MLAHCFGGISPWLDGLSDFESVVKHFVRMEACVEKPVHLMAASKQKERKALGSPYPLHGDGPSDLNSFH